MSRWNTESIRKTVDASLATATDGWSADELRTKLSEVLTSIYPIRVTLSALIDNPKIPKGGMVVYSDLFPETFGEEAKAGIREPFGLVYQVDSHEWGQVNLDWASPPPEEYQRIEAQFAAGQELHDGYTIMDVWQSAIAASIHRGSFDASDVRALDAACALPNPQATGR